MGERQHMVDEVFVLSGLEYCKIRDGVLSNQTRCLLEMNPIGRSSDFAVTLLCFQFFVAPNYPIIFIDTVEPHCDRDCHSVPHRFGCMFYVLSSIALFMCL